MTPRKALRLAAQAAFVALALGCSRAIPPARTADLAAPAGAGSPAGPGTPAEPGQRPGVAVATAPATAPTAGSSPRTGNSATKVLHTFVGFDRNDYPGDPAMTAFRATFDFTGYWLTPPPGETMNTWLGKRTVLRRGGWGFLVLANGKLDAEILKSQKAGTPPAALGRGDAAVAVAAAAREGFPHGTVLFLDQEEGGRLLDEQAAYLLGWTEAVAASPFRPGVYASGQLVEDDPGVHIDTVRDIRARVAAGKLHPVAIFDAQDACPPAPGCTLRAAPLGAAGEPDLAAWQYAQSPRRPAITRSCATTYAADGNCYAASAPRVSLDMDTAESADPSHGR